MTTPTDTREVLRIVMMRELDAIIREVDLYPDDEMLWQTLPGVTNSGGNLALHAAGNLQHFLGAILGGSGYVRDRDAEFSRRAGTRQEVIGELIRTREVIDRLLGSTSPVGLDQPYPQPVGDRRFITGPFLIHLATHLAFHLGQIGYLRRTLTGANQSVGAVSNAMLAIS